MCSSHDGLDLGPPVPCHGVLQGPCWQLHFPMGARAARSRPVCPLGATNDPGGRRPGRLRRAPSTGVPGRQSEVMAHPGRRGHRSAGVGRRSAVEPTPRHVVVAAWWPRPFLRSHTPSATSSSTSPRGPAMGLVPLGVLYGWSALRLPYLARFISDPRPRRPRGSPGDPRYVVNPADGRDLADPDSARRSCPPT